MANRTSRDDVDRIKRDVDLIRYASSFGFYVDERESTPRGNPVNWILRRDADGEKLFARRKEQGWVYKSLRDPANHGTVIDFAQRELGFSKGAGTPGFGRTLRELRAFLGDDRSVGPPPRNESHHSPSPDRAALRAEFAAAEALETPRYLVAVRSLSTLALCDERFRACWRVDARGNVLFPHHDELGLSGYESKNLDFTHFRGAKGMWHSRTRPGDDRLIISEAPIDALSYHQLNTYPRARYLSPSGTMGRHQEELLVRAIAKMPPESPVVLAVDNDAGGDRFVRRVRELAPDANLLEHRPPTTAKDWNEHLRQAERKRDERSR
jgi:hypothetical protein